MSAWGYLRHFINLKILWSVLTEFTTVGPYELNWETQQYKCWIAQYITFSLLAALQAVNLFWWFLICRIAYRFVTASGLADERSEYEDSDAEVEGREKKSAKAIKVNGKPAVNGVTNGTPNGTPKVLINGEAPETPDRTTTAKENGSIGSRVRARKGQK
jgi:acyl-CoA-dependent ceramide synthase